MKAILVIFFVVHSSLFYGQIERYLTYSTTSNPVVDTVGSTSTTVNLFLYVPINDTIYLSGLNTMFGSATTLDVVACPLIGPPFECQLVTILQGTPLPDQVKFRVQNYPFSINYQTFYCLGIPGSLHGSDNTFCFYMTAVTGVGLPTNVVAPGVVQVYPIPLSDVLHVNLPGEAVYGLTISNALGVICLEQETQGPEADIAVAELKPGVYTLEVFEAGRLVDKKRMVK